MGTKHQMVIAAAAVLVVGGILWGSGVTNPVAHARFVIALMSDHIPGDRFVEVGAAHQQCDVWHRLPTGPVWRQGWLAHRRRLRDQEVETELLMPEPETELWIPRKPCVPTPESWSSTWINAVALISSGVVLDR